MAWSEAELERLRARVRRRPRRADARPEVRARSPSGSSAAARGRRPSSACRPSWPRRTGWSIRRRRTSPGSTWRSAACRSTSAPSTGPARASARARCARSSGSGLTTTCSLRAAARHGGRRRRRRAVLEPLRHRLGPSRDRGLDRGDRRAGRAAAVASAAIIRSAIRSCAPSGATGRSASSISTRIPTPAGPFDGLRENHGAPFRNAVLAGVLDPTRTMQIGLRGASEYLYEFAPTAA